MRISDWSSDVCSSDLADLGEGGFGDVERLAKSLMQRRQPVEQTLRAAELVVGTVLAAVQQLLRLRTFFKQAARMRSEEHTYELQSLMRISYAVFCMKKKNVTYKRTTVENHINK